MNGFYVMTLLMMTLLFIPKIDYNFRKVSFGVLKRIIFLFTLSNPTFLDNYGTRKYLFIGRDFTQVLVRSCPRWIFFILQHNEMNSHLKWSKLKQLISYADFQGSVQAKCTFRIYKLIRKFILESCVIWLVHIPISIEVGDILYGWPPKWVILCLPYRRVKSKENITLCAKNNIRKTWKFHIIWQFTVIKDLTYINVNKNKASRI